MVTPLALACVALLLIAGIVWGAVVLTGHLDPSAVGTSKPGPARTPNVRDSAGSTTAPVAAAVPSQCPAPTQKVSTAKALTAALSAAHPGSVIQLEPGNYVGNFVAAAVGTAGSPIWLCGAATTVLDGGKTDAGYVLHLERSAYWHLLGFAVRNGQKGVVADGAANNIIEGLTVSTIGDEGIHLRSASTHNLVTGNSVTDTGRRKSKFGEGIYVGSAKSNWCKYAACQPDRSDDNTLSNNIISHTTAESIDIKEGTTGGTVVGNSFDGSGMVQSGADSWIDVKGDGWTISSNRGVNSVNDGFQTHEIVSGWGTGNRFSNNTLAVDGPGFGIHLTPSLDNTVDCSNSVSGAAQGLSNIACTK
ncbi:MAG: right-handed parallel beta-helix repeat-containing protein [Kineosporiaceae bacterium]|nr:right-handed parallel beta-helix repeat-containing protein [Aeromicrobium sp.]